MGCNKCLDKKEYCGTMPACFEKGLPKCPAEAVIPSMTLDTTEGLKQLSNTVVHVISDNTTYYVDDKHRITEICSEPVSRDNYDFANNPEKFAGQIVFDYANNIAFYYDNSGRAFEIAEDFQGAITAEANARIAADNDLQTEINNLKNSPDVVDIVDTYADLEAYDTQHLGDNDIIRVLTDETHDGESSYYRWDKHNETWVFIGSINYVYTGGNGIDITDNEVSAKLGRGLAFDNDGDIDVSEEYIIGFDTVADMKSAENLVAGSFARTMGYYAKNDGGEALYKIRTVANDDVVDEMFIIEITADPSNNLVAELVKESPINAKALGIKTGEDMATKIATAITSGNVIYFPSGTYLLGQTVTAGTTVNIIGDGETTIFNSTNGTLYPVFDFSNATNIKLQGFSTSNSSFKVYPTPSSGKTAQEMMADKNVYISNVVCNTVSSSIGGKTNWAGLFINTPKPNHYSPRDFEDGKYARYGIELYNSSGYNAINIENVMKDDQGNYENVSDNSAIGIVDGVLSSAQAVFIDMHAERAALGIKNRTATSSASSTARPDLVYEVGYNGHLAIGCSVYDETGAAGTGTVKLKDNAPMIRYYDTNYPTHIAFQRLQNDKFQTAVNGVIRSEYLNNGYHEYSYPIRMKKVADSHGGLIFGSDFAAAPDIHMFGSANGYIKVNRTAADTVQTADSGYVLQECVSGATTSRPTSRLTNDWQSIGFRYFDTTLGKPVFWNGTGWVDATGAAA